jgi:hypothetical protein
MKNKIEIIELSKNEKNQINGGSELGEAILYGAGWLIGRIGKTFYSGHGLQSNSQANSKWPSGGNKW